MLYLKFFGILLIASLVQWTIIRFFQKKNVFQPIYDLSPQSHQQKQWTPSFGGVGMLVSLWIAWAIIGYDVFSFKIMWVMGVFSAFSFLGLVDDSLSVLKKKNQGFTSRQKFLCQWILAIVSLIVYSVFLSPLSVITIILYAFVMVGASNATNLTDGLDGLLASCSIVTCIGFYLIGNDEIKLFCILLIIILISFLLFNRYPAKIFMGDTGSLGLGALFAGLAIVYENVWVLISLGAVYVIETVSVLIQVAYFKKTKQRIFLMAPLHHHFELLGLSEPAIVRLFVILSGIGICGFFVL
jgi:phospho-N-acetylmuramoyl-pentapeptide-transferase